MHIPTKCLQVCTNTIDQVQFLTTSREMQGYSNSKHEFSCSVPIFLIFISVWQCAYFTLSRLYNYNVWLCFRQSFHRKQTDTLQVRSVTYTPLVMLTRLYKLNTIQMGNGHEGSHWLIESPIMGHLFVIRLYKINVNLF